MKKIVIFCCVLLLPFFIQTGVNAEDNAVITGLQTEVQNLKGGLPAEQAARIAKDADLQNQIDNIQLTPGPQGPAGPQGPQGPTGEDGVDGVCVPQECPDTSALLERLNYLENRLQNSDFDGDGLTPAGGDCDDTDPDIPGSYEVPDDGIDNDCDGITDDFIDADGDGSPLGLDCDDNDANAFPGQTEGFPYENDFNCDGVINPVFGKAEIPIIDWDGTCEVRTSGWLYYDPLWCGDQGEWVDEGLTWPSSFAENCEDTIPQGYSYLKVQLCNQSWLKFE